MFDIRNFVLKGINKMIGNEPDYKIIKYALGWYDKEVLTADDLAQIDTNIDAYAQSMTADENVESGEGDDI